MNEIFQFPSTEGQGAFTTPVTFDSDTLSNIYNSSLCMGDHAGYLLLSI